MRTVADKPQVGIFDEAFKSRVHVSLYYPPLDLSKTKQIWSSHIETAERNNSKVVCDSDIRHFGEELFEQQIRRGNGPGPVWNGRQIRNAFQSAMALATYEATQSGKDKIQLSRSHFTKVANVSASFDDYLLRTHHGVPEHKRNYDNMTRYDLYGTAAHESARVVEEQRRAMQAPATQMHGMQQQTYLQPAVQQPAFNPMPAPNHTPVAWVAGNLQGGVPQQVHAYPQQQPSQQYPPTMAPLQNQYGQSGIQYAQQGQQQLPQGMGPPQSQYGQPIMSNGQQNQLMKDAPGQQQVLPGTQMPQSLPGAQMGGQDARQ